MFNKVELFSGFKGKKGTRLKKHCLIAFINFVELSEIPFCELEELKHKVGSKRYAIINSVNLILDKKMGILQENCLNRLPV